MYLSLKLGAFVFLVGRCFGELFRRLGTSLLDLGSGRKKTPVLCCLPLHEIVMRNDGHVSGFQNLIAAGVIEMVVAIDRVFDGKFGLRFDHLNEFSDGRRREKSIEDKNALITDHETCIAGSQAAGFGNRGVNAFTNFYKPKMSSAF